MEDSEAQESEASSWLDSSVPDDSSVQEDSSVQDDSSVTSKETWVEDDTRKSAEEETSCDTWVEDNTAKSVSETTQLEIIEEVTRRRKNKRQSRPFPWALVRSIVLGMFSMLLLILFVLAAAIAGEESGGVSWVIFFSLNAAVPFIYLIYWACCFPIMAIHVLAMVNAVWSIVYLIIVAVNGRSSPKTTGTLENNMSVRDSHTIGMMRQNAVIAMASIGFFSSMYHSLMAEKWIARDTEKTEDEEVQTED